jgi:hypothetical protein
MQSKILYSIIIQLILLNEKLEYYLILRASALNIVAIKVSFFISILINLKCSDHLREREKSSVQNKVIEWKYMSYFVI